MSDKEPLLKRSSKSSQVNDDDDNEDNKQPSTTTFSDWRQRFGDRDVHDKYKKPDHHHNDDNDDDDTKNNHDKEQIGFFDLFRFANGTELFLMFISVCFAFVNSSALLASYLILSRAIGLFAMEAFRIKCNYLYPNTDTNNNGCPLGIDMNAFNYDKFHKLCPDTSSPTLIPSFRMQIMNFVSWLFVIGAIQFLASIICYFTWQFAAKRQISRISVRLFSSLIQRNISYLDANSNNQSNSKLFRNINKIERGISLKFLALLTIIFEFICTIIIAFIISWELTLVMLCFMVIINGASFLFIKVTGTETKSELNAYGKAGQIVQEVFSSIQTVLSLNGIKYEQKRYEKELHSTNQSSVRQGSVFGIFIGWLSLRSFIIYTVGFICGFFLMSPTNPNKLTISDILVIVFMFAQSIVKFDFSNSFIQAFSQAKQAAAPIFRLIDEVQQASLNEDILKSTTPDIESNRINGDVEFNDVNFAYPSRNDVPILYNLNLIARAGQTTALVGSRGSGKSTCVSLLLRFYEPTSGRITINNRSIKDYNLQQLRQNIGVVSQESILLNISIYENIRFGKLNATRSEIEEAAQQSNAHDFIMQLPNKYETIIGEHGLQLSVSEKQRIVLARALVKRPTLLLLDDVTGGLDNVNEKIVQEAIDRASHGRTTIVITDRLSTIQNAHQIYVLDNGIIIEQGTHETLMEKVGGKYETMVKNQKVKTLTDNQDDKMNIDKAIEKDKQIFQRTRLSNYMKTLDMDKEESFSKKQQSAFLRLLTMNQPEWFTILMGCITCLANGAAQIGFAILLAEIVQSFEYCTRSEQYRQVLVFSLGFFLLGVIVFILRAFQYTAFAISGSKLIYRIRLLAFACLLRQEIAYFDQPENNPAAINTRLSSEALSIQRMIGTRLGIFCESLALAVLAFIFGFIYSWELTLITLFPIIFYIVACYVNIQIEIRHNLQMSLILVKANSLSTEVIDNIRTIKQLSVERQVLHGYSQLIYQTYRKSQSVLFSSAIANGIYYALITYTTAFILWCARVLYEEKKLASNNIIMIFAFIIFIHYVLRIVAMLCKAIATPASSAQKYFDLFDRTPTIDNGSMEGQELENFNGKIAFNQVDFVYPIRSSSIILNKFQMTIEPGQRIALVGTTGCGKSTIIKLLERFYDVTQGQIYFDGIDIRELNIQWVRSCFGLVSQKPVLFDLTIAENITYGLENVPTEEIVNAATKANIHTFIQQLPEGYDTRVGKKGDLLSVGEKQRIAIARTLVRQPKVLLWDDATTAMDSHNEQIIQQTLEEAQMDNLDRTTFIIAHRLSTIQHCDKIYVLHNEHIVESGTHTELMEQHGIYRDMFNKENPNE